MARRGGGVARDDVWATYESLNTGLDAFQRAADADLAALLRDELRGVVSGYETLKRLATSPRAHRGFPDICYDGRKKRATIAPPLLSALDLAYLR